jgi:hypothetical protein
MPDIVNELLSEKALTAVMLPRYHVERIINRTLGSRITSLENAKNTSERAVAMAATPGDGSFILNSARLLPGAAQADTAKRSTLTPSVAAEDLIGSCSTATFGDSPA